MDMPYFEFDQLPEITDFSPEERSPAVRLLLGICHRQREQLLVQQNRIEMLQAQILEQSEQLSLQAEEIRQLKLELKRVNLEREILKKALVRILTFYQVF